MARTAPDRRREQARDADGYLPIEHHGIIGDLHTVALVGNEGTIDWFCPGRFDAPSMFGAILDAEKGGRFSIQPVNGGFTTKQLYLPGTAVLVTRFFTEGGVGEVVDFMPLDETGCTIMRRIEVVRGSLTSASPAGPPSTTRARGTGSRSTVRSRRSSRATTRASCARSRARSRRRATPPRRR